MKLSVIIPIYNEAKYLEDLLATLDVCGDAEVLVVDDVRSSDGAVDVCIKYGAQYLQTDCDVSHARNYGAFYATGEYLLFLDADQFLWSEIPLRDMVDYLKKYPYVDVATGPIEQEKEEDVFFSHAEIREIYRFVTHTLSGGYIIIKKYVFEKIGGFTPRKLSLFTWEDLDLDLRARASGYNIYYFPFSTTHRRSFNIRTPEGKVVGKIQ